MAYQRRDGQWVAPFDLGKTEDGKRRRKVFYGATEAEAEGKRQRALERLTGRPTAKSSESPSQEAATLTVGAWLDQWLADTKKTVSLSTHVSYSQIVRDRLKPAIGDVLLPALTNDTVQEMVNKLCEGKLSPRTIQYTHAVLRRALNVAVRKKKHIPFNPAQHIDLPRRVKPELRTLTPEEIATFLGAIRCERWLALFTLAIYTGLRRSELVGLKWHDIDRRTGTIHVRRKIVQIKKETIIEAPKADSRRAVTVEPFVINLLLSLPRRSEWVFSTKTGRNLNPSMVNRAFYQICKDAGISGVRLHDIRHTFATLLLLEGVHPKVVQELLGHSSIAITMDTYTHVPTPAKTEASTKLANRIQIEAEGYSEAA